MTVQTATGPDGFEWSIRTSRRRPRSRAGGDRASFIERVWRSDPDLVDTGFAVLLSAVGAALASAIALPYHVVRSTLSGEAFVEAVCTRPGGIRVIWRTDRRRARAVAGAVAAQIERGLQYEDVPYGQLVEMNPPRASLTDGASGNDGTLRLPRP